MPLPRDQAGQAQRTGLMDTGFFRPGDYVVPEYSEQGAKLSAGTVVGESEAADKLARMMASHALMEGAEPIIIPQVVDIKGKKKAKRSKLPKPGKATQQEIDNVRPVIRADLTPTPIAAQPVELQPASPPIEVVFSTQLGRIKVNVLAVLDSLTALVLVFANDGEIRYEPAAGAEVQLVINGRLERTMYPGFKFPWIDGKRQLMVFVKLPEE